MGNDTQLRVLIANQRVDRLDQLERVVLGIGHDVVARETEVDHVGSATASENPDVALVEVGVNSDHALDLITRIAHEAACPVIALLSAKDSGHIREATKRGAFAYIVDPSPEVLQSAIDICLQRFAEYQTLKRAFGRRALIEQAKGMLMERHEINADDAFEMLRTRSRASGRKLFDIAHAIIDSHLMLAPPSRVKKGEAGSRGGESKEKRVRLPSTPTSSSRGGESNP